LDLIEDKKIDEQKDQRYCLIRFHIFGICLRVSSSSIYLFYLRYAVRKSKEDDSQIEEQGDIFFFFRPKVGTELRQIIAHYSLSIYDWQCNLVKVSLCFATTYIGFESGLVWTYVSMPFSIVYYIESVSNVSLHLLQTAGMPVLSRSSEMYGIDDDDIIETMENI
jgi:hypothetical protein